MDHGISRVSHGYDFDVVTYSAAVPAETPAASTVPSSGAEARLVLWTIDSKHEILELLHEVLLHEVLLVRFFFIIRHLDDASLKLGFSCLMLVLGGKTIAGARAAAAAAAKRKMTPTSR